MDEVSGFSPPTTPEGLAPGSSTYGAREGGATALVVLAVAVAAREKQGRGKGAREGSVN